MQLPRTSSTDTGAPSAGVCPATSDSDAVGAVCEPDVAGGAQNNPLRRAGQRFAGDAVAVRIELRDVAENGSTCSTSPGAARQVVKSVQFFVLPGLAGGDVGGLGAPLAQSALFATE